MLDGFVGSLQLPVVLALLQIHVALGGDVAVGDNVIDQFVVVVHDGLDSEINVFVET